MKEPAAADSTCLIGLDRISRIDLIDALFEPVFVAPEINREYGKPIPWATFVAKPDQRDVAVLRMIVDSGEAEAIVVAVNKACTLITDDKQARTAAKALGVKVIGTVGILIRAKRAGLIDSIKPIIEDLSSSGFFISKTLVHEALEIAGEDLSS